MFDKELFPQRRMCWIRCKGITVSRLEIYYIKRGKEKVNRIIGKQFHSIFRVADMLCLNFGTDLQIEWNEKKRIVPEYSFHIQTQWRFIRNDTIILASRDIYKPYSNQVPDDWEYDQFGRSDEESNIFDVLREEICNCLNGCVVTKCDYTVLGDLTITFSDGTLFETFTPSSRKEEFWRLLDYINNEHLVVFEEKI